MNKMDHIELGLVGSVLNDSSRLIEVDCLPVHFETRAYAEIFNTILTMAAENQAIDTFTVIDRIERDTGKDWAAIVAQVASNSFAAQNTKAYSQSIKRKFVEREAKAIAENMVEMIDYEGQAAVDETIIKLMALGNESKQTAFAMKDALRQCVEHLQRVNEGAESIALSSGFESLDANIGGFHDTDLIIIGARPAMGKTALLLNFILNAGCPSGFISTEQSAMQIALRMMCIQGGVKGSKLRSGNFNEEDWSAVTASMAFLSERQIWIDEETRPTIADVQRQARRWKQQYGIEALWVDYIQRIEGTDSRAPKVERVEEVTKGLKSLARELDLPVVALAQVNRSVDSKTNKRPGMGDLSDSSAIEKEADQIMMLYRDEVYDPNTNDPGIAELIIEKNRHGPTNFMRLGWIGETFRFKDLTNGYQ